MSKRDFGREILEGIREVKAYKAGEKALRTHTLKEPAAPQVIRAKLHLSQSAFAGLMGVSLRTVQDWEQGRRKPSGPAAALLRIAEQQSSLPRDGFSFSLTSPGVGVCFLSPTIPATLIKSVRTSFLSVFC